MRLLHSGALNRMLKMILWVFIVYAGYCSILFLAQRLILFPRHMVTPLEGADKSIPSLEKIWLPMDFGQVEAWYLPPAPVKRNTPSPLVIFAHGNAELIDFCPPEMLPFTEWGIGVLLVEFPGYGRSGGIPSQRSITETFVSAYDTMTRRADIDADRIIFYARSIGGGAVCSLLRERPAAAVILMSTFKSVRSFARRYLAPGFLVRDPFDNLSVIKDYDGPLLIFHGKQDEVIPFSHGQSLHQANPKSRFISYECGHNDCPPDWIHFWREIGSFLKNSGL